MHDVEVGGVEAAQSADATPATAVALRVAVQGEAGSTGDRPSHGLAAILARRMSGDDVLTELLLDAGAGVDEVPHQARCRLDLHNCHVAPPERARPPGRVLAE